MHTYVQSTAMHDVLEITGNRLRLPARLLHHRQVQHLDLQAPGVTTKA